MSHKYTCLIHRLYSELLIFTLQNKYKEGLKLQFSKLTLGIKERWVGIFFACMAMNEAAVAEGRAEQLWRLI